MCSSQVGIESQCVLSMLLVTTAVLRSVIGGDRGHATRSRLARHLKMFYQGGLTIEAALRAGWTCAGRVRLVRMSASSGRAAGPCWPPLACDHSRHVEIPQACCACQSCRAMHNGKRVGEVDRRASAMGQRKSNRGKF